MTRPQQSHSSQGELRPLTVMFCDLVGSTALVSSLDPEEWADVLRGYRDACSKVIAQYGGRVVQYNGDDVMAYFGLPNAHEENAERAVRAALDIIPVVRGVSPANPLSVHIGIASGTVMFDARAGDGLDAWRAVGDTPHLAAGLQTRAGAGEVFIADSTRRLLGADFELSYLGELSLKQPRPLPAWRVHGVRKTEGRFHAAHGASALTPLVGRERELEVLRDRWRRARQGRGQAVLICGDAGIGKSRLAEALSREIAGEPHTTLRYQCSPHRLHAALYPVIAQIEFASAFVRDDTPEQKIAKMKATLVGSEMQRASAARFLAPLLGLPLERPHAADLSPQQRKARTFAALIGQLDALAERDPVVVVFEDAQWIDPTTQELLDLLMARLPSLRALVVLTHRPQFERWKDVPEATALVLDGLPPDVSAELVARVAQAALPADVVSSVLKRAEGVPLFIEELTRSIVESGASADSEDRYTRFKALPDTEVPAKVKEQLIERLDSLGSVRWLALLGACIGREFSYELLAAISPQTGADLRRELEQLTDTGLVVQRSGFPQGLERYTFKHALIQEAAYESVLKSERRHWHAKIAEALESLNPERRLREPELVAHHLTRAGRLADAIPLWRSAGEQALARVALQEAVAYLETGLSLLEPLPASAERDALELTLRERLHGARLSWQGWAAPEVGANAAALLRLVIAHDPQKNRTSFVVALWGMWINTITQGRIAESPAWAERLLAEARKYESLDLEILGHRARLSSYLFAGELRSALREAERVRDLYDPGHASRWITLTGNDVHTAVGIFSSYALWMAGYPDQAAAVAVQKDAHARALGHPFDLGWALTWGAYVFDFRREPQRVLTLVKEAEALGRDQNIPLFYRVVAPAGEGLARLRMGELDAAIELLRTATQRWTARSGHLNIPYLKAAWAEALALRGDLDGSVRLLDECLEQIERPGWGERVWLPEVLRLKGWVYSRQGRLDDAEAHLRQSLEWARRHEARSWELRTATTLAGLLAERNRSVEGRAILAPVYEWFTEGFETADLRAASDLLERLR